MKRILIIRGGAIGDFILTLPALKALREAYPGSHIEILGYSHIAALADKRFYANAVRSIEYGALSRFFARNAELPDELAQYFAEFDLIISYLFDPDRIFQTNLERAGADTIITGPAKIRRGDHAAMQLGRPMIEDLELEVDEEGASIFVSAEDKARAEEFLQGLPAPVVALHPGSGSEKKNWPADRWRELAMRLLADETFEGSLVIVLGEADQAGAEAMKSLGKNSRVRLAQNLPLPELAAILARALFVGHDSGISHLAAAAGARSLVLFGPSDPGVWRPLGQNVTILRAPGGLLEDVSVEKVQRQLGHLLFG